MTTAGHIGPMQPVFAGAVGAGAILVRMDKLIVVDETGITFITPVARQFW